MPEIVGHTRSPRERFDLRDLFAPPEWMQDALCREVDLDVFFPDRGQPSTQAREICARCFVTDECLEWALAYESGSRGTATSYALNGIYGGRSPKQRKKILDQRGAS